MGRRIRQGCEVYMEDMSRPFGGDDSLGLVVLVLVRLRSLSFGLRRPRRRRTITAALVDESLDRRRRQMQPGSSEQVGNPSATKMGEAELESSDDFPDEVREAIHGCGGPHESVFSLFIESSQPSRDGGGSEAEVPSGLGHAPTAGGLERQDGETLDGRKVRPPSWIDAGCAGVLDSQLLAQQRDLAFEALDLPAESHAFDRAVTAPPADEGQRPMGGANECSSAVRAQAGQPSGMGTRGAASMIAHSGTERRGSIGNVVRPACFKASVGVLFAG